MHLLLAMALLAGPTGNSADACDKLWEDTVTAAAPDLEPSDELRKSYLAKERAQLVMKCRGASAEMLACPPQATKICAAKFPTPTDGGRALGLATCVYPEVQSCAQLAYIRSSVDAVGALLKDLETGKLAPAKGGLLKLTGERALLSIRGEALAEKRGDGFWLLLVTRRSGEQLAGWLVRSPASEPLAQKAEVTIAGVKLELGSVSSAGAEVTTP